MSNIKKSPIIGITTYGRDKKGNFHLPGEYVDAVRQAGGLPILLAPGETNLDQILYMVDGIIFAGGGDIDPKVYGGRPHPTVARVDPDRDAFEISLAKLVRKDAKPVLGICRGFQLLNIAYGGDLIADIPEKYGDKIAHRTSFGGITEHFVHLTPESRLTQIIGAMRISVVSKHHQGAGNITSDWSIGAQADDGIVEALEHRNHPWMIAVLWHPELALDDPNQQKIFKAFVDSAKKKA